MSASLGGKVTVMEDRLDARRPSRHRMLTWVATLALLAACAGNSEPATGARSQSPSESATSGHSTTTHGGQPGEATTTTSPKPATTTTTTTTTTEPEGSGLVQRIPELTTDDLDSGESLERWHHDVPTAQDLWIASSADGSFQPMMWVPPEGDAPVPLLVVLPSWSNGYAQHLGIPFAQWARVNGWAMVHLHTRGVFARPEATGSDTVVADVLDAIDYAVAQGSVDPARVYVMGYSGGGMMALLMAGRHPERFAGAAAWVPIYDLADWYDHNARVQSLYLFQIAASCGGDLYRVPEARDACHHRSPAAHLAGARAAGLPVYLASGADDELVPADHAARSFNALADDGDRIAADDVERIADGAVPAHLDEGAESHFTGSEPDVLLARRSGPVTLVLFDGGHQMVLNPALEWMAHLDAVGR
jgi:dienelactone hydrolase